MIQQVYVYPKPQWTVVRSRVSLSVLDDVGCLMGHQDGCGFGAIPVHDDALVSLCDCGPGGLLHGLEDRWLGVVPSTHLA